MKICLVVPRVGRVKGSFLGGSVNNVVALSKELVKKHEVHLVTSPPVGTSKIEGVDWCQVHPIYLKGDANSLRYGIEFLLNSIHVIKKMHKTEKFDVINTHSGTPNLALISTIAGKICGIPSIHTLYTSISSLSEIDKNQHKILSNYRLFSSLFFSKLQISKLDCVIAISENVAKSVSFNKRVEIIPPCIDVSRFTPVGSRIINFTKNEFGLSDEIIITFLGEREAKGLGILIKAIKEIRREINLKVIIVAGFEKRKIREQIREVEDSVILLDVVNIPSILAITDIFVAPFLSTFDIADIPLSILEAMAVGKPVIASDVGGIPEIIKKGENGILIKPSNVDLLVQEIITLSKDPIRREKLGGNARNYIKKNFSVERIAKRYEKLYEEIAR